MMLVRALQLVLTVCLGASGLEGILCPLGKEENHRDLDKWGIRRTYQDEDLVLESKAGDVCQDEDFDVRVQHGLVGALLGDSFAWNHQGWVSKTESVSEAFCFIGKKRSLCQVVVEILFQKLANDLHTSGSAPSLEDLSPGEEEEAPTGG